jgi:hypothetical protein
MANQLEPERSNDLLALGIDSISGEKDERTKRSQKLASED